MSVYNICFEKKSLLNSCDAFFFSFFPLYFPTFLFKEAPMNFSQNPLGEPSRSLLGKRKLKNILVDSAAGMGHEIKSTNLVYKN